MMGSVWWFPSTRCRTNWLIRFLGAAWPIPDVLRMIQKWLEAGIMEEGQWKEGGRELRKGQWFRRLLANIYLHYVFDLWVEAWRKKRAKGDMIVRPIRG